MTQPSTAIVAHTAGPWVVTDERDRFHGGEVIRPIDRTHSPVAIVCDFNRFDRDAEREANARLIAAAPELLAALKTMLTSDSDVGAISKRQIAEGAIAKAEADS